MRADHCRLVDLQVPAYFDSNQKAAITQAGTMAGLETVRLVRSVAYYESPHPAHLCLCFAHALSQSECEMMFMSEAGHLNTQMAGGQSVPLDCSTASWAVQCVLLL